MSADGSASEAVEALRVELAHKSSELSEFTRRAEQEFSRLRSELGEYADDLLHRDIEIEKLRAELQDRDGRIRELESRQNSSDGSRHPSSMAPSSHHATPPPIPQQPSLSRHHSRPSPFVKSRTTGERQEAAAAADKGDRCGSDMFTSPVRGDGGGGKREGDRAAKAACVQSPALDELRATLKSLRESNHRDTTPPQLRFTPVKTPAAFTQSANAKPPKPPEPRQDHHANATAPRPPARPNLNISAPSGLRVSTAGRLPVSGRRSSPRSVALWEDEEDTREGAEGGQNDAVWPEQGSRRETAERSALTTPQLSSHQPKTSTHHQPWAPSPFGRRVPHLPQHQHQSPEDAPSPLPICSPSPPVPLPPFSTPARERAATAMPVSIAPPELVTTPQATAKYPSWTNATPLERVRRDHAGCEGDGVGGESASPPSVIQRDFGMGVRSSLTAPSPPYHYHKRDHHAVAADHAAAEREGQGGGDEGVGTTTSILAELRELRSRMGEIGAVLRREASKAMEGHAALLGRQRSGAIGDLGEWMEALGMPTAHKTPVPEQPPSDASGHTGLMRHAGPVRSQPQLSRGPQQMVDDGARLRAHARPHKNGQRGEGTVGERDEDGEIVHGRLPTEQHTSGVSIPVLPCPPPQQLPLPNRLSSIRPPIAQRHTRQILRSAADTGQPRSDMLPQRRPSSARLSPPVCPSPPASSVLSSNDLPKDRTCDWNPAPSSTVVHSRDIAECRPPSPPRLQCRRASRLLSGRSDDGTGALSSGGSSDSRRRRRGSEERPHRTLGPVDAHKQQAAMSIQSQTSSVDHPPVITTSSTTTHPPPSTDPPGSNSHQLRLPRPILPILPASQPLPTPKMRRRQSSCDGSGRRVWCGVV